MRILLTTSLSLVLLTAVAYGQNLNAGERAPHFILEGSDGRRHSLDQYIGKQAVVLAWFPKAFTPG